MLKNKSTHSYTPMASIGVCLLYFIRGILSVDTESDKHPAFLSPSGLWLWFPNDKHWGLSPNVSIKNTSLVLVFLCSCVLVFCGCAKREINNVDSRGKNIICFGDSITFGYDADAGQDYPSVLAKMTEIPVINAGIDGDTSVEAIERIRSDVLNKEPLLVIIEFGGNDFLRRIPLQETVKNIEEMIEKIQSVGAMVAIADISAGIIMSNYGKEFRRLSNKYNTIFLPSLLSKILTDASLKSDFIHPNAEGYKVIAHWIYRAILPYLNQNAILRKFN